MNIKNDLSYRLQQFKLAVNPPSQPVPTKELSAHLNAMQLTLFRKLQPSEQWHAFLVFSKLRERGCKDPGLLTAALLHDIGKILFPINTWNRIVIVLVNMILPGQARKWGQKTPTVFNKQFVVADQHAEWGADLVAKTGATELTLNLIRRHEQILDENPISHQDRLLVDLQMADNSS